MLIALNVVESAGPHTVSPYKHTMEEEDPLLLELCREKLITDPFNFFFLSELSEECLTKEARSLEEWEVLAHYELLKKQDYELWSLAIEKENVEVSMKLMSMWTSAITETPNAEYAYKFILHNPDAPTDLLERFYDLTLSDFNNSQLLFVSLVDKLIESGQLDQVRQLYEKRLQIPHKQLQQTYEAYTSFISSNFANTFNEIMRKQSHVMQETERAQRYYERFESQILQSPDDPQVWTQYMQNVYRYAKTLEFKRHFLSVFYRSINEFPNEESWQTVFETAIQMGRECKLDEARIKYMVFSWRKAFPKSLRPLRALVSYATDYKSLNTLRNYVKSAIDGTHECLETVKALIFAQCQFATSSYPLLQILEEDMSSYMSKYPASLELLRVAVTVSNKIPCLKPDDLVLECFEENKYNAEIYNYALRYFSLQESDHAIFDFMVEHFETQAAKFDSPEAVLPYFENYLISISDIESFPSIHNRIEIVKGNIRAAKPKQIKREAEDDAVEDALVEEKKTKRVKEESLEAEPVHRNREQFTIAIRGFEGNPSEAQVRDFLSGYGDPVSITLTHLPEVLIKVELSSEQEVLTCLTKSGKKFAGLTVEIERVFGTTLWLTNYPPSYSHDLIKALLDQHMVDEPISIRFPSQTTTRERRFCYVEFTHPRIANAAQSALDGLVVEEYTLRAEISNPAIKRERAVTSPKHQIYVKNLNFTKTSKESLEAAFARFGSVDSISMPPNSQHKNSLNSGYAFITFKSETSAKEAIAAKMIVLDEREVAIFALKPREAHNRDARSYEELKSVTILNLPSSVTSKQLSTYLEGLVGAVKRLTVESTNHKALVEFEQVADAGKAGFLLLSAEFAGQRLTVSDKRAFFEPAKPKKVEATTKVPMMAAPMMMRRRPRK